MFKLALLALTLFLTLIPALTSAQGAAPQGVFSLDLVADRFPSRGFEHQIEFWTRIFSEYATHQVVLHDQNDLRLIYAEMVFPSGIEGNPAEAKRQREILRGKIRELEDRFDEIRVRGAESPSLTDEHRHLIDLLRKNGYEPDSTTLKKLRGSIRYQRGVRDKFEASLVRSGLYFPWIERVFGEHGLPLELAHLPHVESSFDYNAYSKAGAAGIWQFTRGTGKLYLRIDNWIDERLDPLRATEAAARLLRDNYRALGDWPITITSYNHGKYGMLRAREKHGSDLLAIIANYESKYFGFASRNFYAEFLAALEVARNYQTYFGDLQIRSPLEFDTVHLDRAYDVGVLASVPGVDAEQILDLNPHLKRLVASHGRRIPAGIEVRVPLGSADAALAALREATPTGPSIRLADDGSMRYRVQVGDTIGSIASVYGTSVGELQRLNQLSNPNRIYPGQELVVAAGDYSAPAPTGPVTYTVRPGDSLVLIAKRFGTTLERLLEENELSNPNLIRPGMTLKVVGGGGAASRSYVVRSGDTLGRIAQRFGTSVDRLRQANNLSNPHQIRPGQELMIP